MVSRQLRGGVGGGDELGPAGNSGKNQLPVKSRVNRVYPFAGREKEKKAGAGQEGL